MILIFKSNKFSLTSPFKICFLQLLFYILFCERWQENALLVFRVGLCFGKTKRAFCAAGFFSFAAQRLGYG
jgi:hypothetical protein